MNTTPYTVLYDGSDRKQFLRARQSGVGASDVAAVLGFSKWSTPYDVWLKKTGRAQPQVETEAMEFGTALESVVARRFQVRHGHEVSKNPDHRPIGRVRPAPGVLQSIRHPHLLASPDRIVEEFETGLRVPLEIKTANQFSAHEWAEAVPLYYQSQSQAQQLVWWPEGEEQHGWVSPLLGGNRMPDPFKLPFDEEFAEFLIADVERFWVDHVLADVPPPLTLADDEHTKSLVPARGRKIVATPEIAALVAERKALSPRMSDDKKRDDAIKAEIRLFMGEATHLVLEAYPDNALLTWDLPKTPPKEESVFDLDAFKAAHPALAQEFTTRQKKPQSRTMSFK